MITTDHEVVRDLREKTPSTPRKTWVLPMALLVLVVMAVAWWMLAQGGTAQIHDSWMNVPVELPVTFTA